MEKPELKTIEINGKQAVLFVPELVENLAIVDLNVLKRLAALLPTANLEEIKTELCHQLNHVGTLADYVVLLRNEISFHESVNMITLYKPGKPQTPAPEARPWPSKD